ncbi:MAG TPA: hypothetical protein VLK85_31825 [Ramlibacter sp.]|nr:hypothetical protein [Ramlibacter sp.]
MSSNGRYDALWPRGERNVTVGALAPRLKSLAGRRVALLWDYLFKGDVVMNEIAVGLKEMFPGVEFVHWDEFGNTHGPQEREIVAGVGARMRALRVDAALSGMGC